MVKFVRLQTVAIVFGAFHIAALIITGALHIFDNNVIDVSLPHFYSQSIVLSLDTHLDCYRLFPVWALLPEIQISNPNDGVLRLHHISLDFSQLVYGSSCSFAGNLRGSFYGETRRNH